MRLIQIVPRLGPFDGVGDYALRLAAGLQERHAVTSSFVEAGTRPAGSPVVLADALGAGASHVLLHYVGYGYAERGAPLWLARAIEGTRRALRYRLGVVFHELHATGRPWRSSFWLSPLQKHVTRRIARECDGALLTREGNRQWLEGTGALTGKPVAVLPVPSGVGEPEAVAQIGVRQNALVVWGGVGMKRAVYEEYWPRVLEACLALGVTRIEDVGAPADRYPSAAGLALERHGFLPAAELSRILGGARFGLVVYPQEFLAKSTLFAAYAAHGMVPLVLDDARSPAMDGLTAGRQFLAFDPLTPAMAPSTLDEVARAARAWYAEHTTARHADGVWRMLGEGRP